jgi:ribosomal protein S1
MNFIETEENGKTFAELLEGTIKGVNSGSVVQGTIIGHNETEVSVGLGFKYDGAVPIEEFTSAPDFNAEIDLKPGTLIDVFVVRVDDKEGKIQLSKKKVDFMKDFRIAEKAYNDRVPLEVRDEGSQGRRHRAHRSLRHIRAGFAGERPLYEGFRTVHRQDDADQAH